MQAIILSAIVVCLFNDLSNRRTRPWAAAGGNLYCMWWCIGRRWTIVWYVQLFDTPSKMQYFVLIRKMPFCLSGKKCRFGCEGRWVKKVEIRWGLRFVFNVWIAFRAFISVYAISHFIRIYVLKFKPCVALIYTQPSSAKLTSAALVLHPGWPQFIVFYLFHLALSGLLCKATPTDMLLFSPV